MFYFQDCLVGNNNYIHMLWATFMYAKTINVFNVFICKQIFIKCALELRNTFLTFICIMNITLNLCYICLASVFFYPIYSHDACGIWQVYINNCVGFQRIILFLYARSAVKMGECLECLNIFNRCSIAKISESGQLIFQHAVRLLIFYDLNNGLPPKQVKILCANGCYTVH